MYHKCQPDWDPGSSEIREHSGQGGVLNPHGNFFSRGKKNKRYVAFSTVEYRQLEDLGNGYQLSIKKNLMLTLELLRV